MVYRLPLLSPDEWREEMAIDPSVAVFFRDFVLACRWRDEARDEPWSTFRERDVPDLEAEFRAVASALALRASRLVSRSKPTEQRLGVG